MAIALLARISLGFTMELPHDRPVPDKKARRIPERWGSSESAGDSISSLYGSELIDASRQVGADVGRGGESVRTYGPETTSDEVLEGVDLTGKVVVVTGASSGLGLDAAQAMAAHGAEVVMAVRDPIGAGGAAETVGPNGHLVELDLASLGQVRKAAAAIIERWPRIDVVVNNAGVMSTPPLTHRRGVRPATRRQPPWPLPPDGAAGAGTRAIGAHREHHLPGSHGVGHALGRPAFSGE